MNRIIPYVLLVTVLCGACRSHKEATRTQSQSADSISLRSETIVVASIDSAFRHLDMTFDTLNVSVFRDSARLAPRVEIRAVNGHITRGSRHYRDAVTARERLDTIAYHVTSNDTSGEHTATTAVYNPPDTTAALGLFILLLAVAVILLYLRRKQ